MCFRELGGVRRSSPRIDRLPRCRNPLRHRGALVVVAALAVEEVGVRMGGLPGGGEGRLLGVDA